MVFSAAIKRRIRNLLPRLSAPETAEADLRKDSENDILYEDDDLTVIYRPGPGNDCIVSFTGVGRAMGGIDLQTPEFSQSGSDAQKIFVIDRQRSWGNRIDWDQLEGLVRAVAGDRRVVTLGNSMGGFLAILAASRLRAEQTVAFAPQWSVDPSIVPEETRWSDYRNAIDAFRVRDLSRAFDTPCRFHLFFGDHPLDRVHFNRFPRGCDNLDLFLLKGGGHEIGLFLKERDVLYPVIDTCLAGGRAMDLFVREDLRYIKI